MKRATNGVINGVPWRWGPTNEAQDGTRFPWRWHVYSEDGLELLGSFATRRELEQWASRKQKGNPGLV